MITNFSGKHSFLSNFHPCTIVDNNGKRWPTAEHLFQSMKTTSESEKEIIRSQKTPGKAKRMGRKIELRTDWETIKVICMLDCLTMKFEQNKELANLLVQTGNEHIVEGNNWHDNFWGACSCSSCRNIEARNQLGELLMQIRSNLTHVAADLGERCANCQSNLIGGYCQECDMTDTPNR